MTDKPLFFGDSTVNLMQRTGKRTSVHVAVLTELIPVTGISLG